MEAEAVGERAMAGEDDALESARFRLRGILRGRAVCVFAEGRVAVGFVEERWHGGVKSARGRSGPRDERAPKPRRRKGGVGEGSKRWSPLSERAGLLRWS